MPTRSGPLYEVDAAAWRDTYAETQAAVRELKAGRPVPADTSHAVRRRLVDLGYEAAGDLSEAKAAARRVRTPEGARLYGLPIGAVIKPDALPGARRVRVPVPEGSASAPARRQDPGVRHSEYLSDGGRAFAEAVPSGPVAANELANPTLKRGDVVRHPKTGRPVVVQRVAVPKGYAVPYLYFRDQETGKAGLVRVPSLEAELERVTLPKRSPLGRPVTELRPGMRVRQPGERYETLTGVRALDESPRFRRGSYELTFADGTQAYTQVDARWEVEDVPAPQPEPPLPPVTPPPFEGRDAFALLRERYPRIEYRGTSKVMTGVGGTLKVSDSEAAALGDYFGYEFKRINKALRAGKTPPEARVIDAVLKRGALEEDVVVFRGVNAGSAVGDVIKNRGYLSTTPDEALARHYATHDEQGRPAAGAVMRLTLPKGTPAFYRDVPIYWANKPTDREREVLAARDVELRVTGREVRDGVTYLDVTPVIPGVTPPEPPLPPLDEPETDVRLKLTPAARTAAYDRVSGWRSDGDETLASAARAYLDGDALTADQAWRLADSLDRAAKAQEAAANERDTSDRAGARREARALTAAADAFEALGRSLDEQPKPKTPAPAPRTLDDPVIVDPPTLDDAIKDPDLVAHAKAQIKRSAVALDTQRQLDEDGENVRGGVALYRGDLYPERDPDGSDYYEKNPEAAKTGFTNTDLARLEDAKHAYQTEVGRRLGWTAEETEQSLAWLARMWDTWRTNGGLSGRRIEAHDAVLALREGAEATTPATRGMLLQKAWTNATWNLKYAKSPDAPITVSRFVQGEYAMRLETALATRGDDWEVSTWPLTSWAVEKAADAVQRRWIGRDTYAARLDREVDRDHTWMLLWGEPRFRTAGLKAPGEIVPFGEAVTPATTRVTMINVPERGAGGTLSTHGLYARRTMLEAGGRYPDASLDDLAAAVQLVGGTTTDVRSLPGRLLGLDRRAWTDTAYDEAKPVLDLPRPSLPALAAGSQLDVGDLRRRGAPDDLVVRRVFTYGGRSPDPAPLGTFEDRSYETVKIETELPPWEDTRAWDAFGALLDEVREKGWRQDQLSLLTNQLSWLSYSRMELARRSEGLRKLQFTKKERVQPGDRVSAARTYSADYVYVMESDEVAAERLVKAREAYDRERAKILLMTDLMRLEGADALLDAELERARTLLREGDPTNELGSGLGEWERP